MKLVAIARAPARAEEAAAALAGAAGLTLAEARMRLAPEAPALLARVEAARAEALVAALRRAGLAALAVALPVPGDEDRTVARRVELAQAGAVFTTRQGDALELAWDDVAAVLRGARTTRTEVARAERTTRLSPGRALATGGLSLTRTSTRTSRSTQEDIEQVILVYARDGHAALVAEGELDFSCLGAGMQPSSTGNMVELASRLRARSPRAFHDDRLLRLGRRPIPFLAGGESREQTATMTQTRVDTRGSLDVLAEVLRQAVAAGLLP